MSHCVKGKQVRVLSSPAGYYIGTTDRNEFPHCRISGYYCTQEEARNHLQGGFIVRDAVEVYYCNGGRGCGVGNSWAGCDCN